MTLTIILVYLVLVLVLVIGSISHRLFRGTGEDYFVASRSIGPFLLLMSLFGTNMTAFAILGASGEAYHTGIGVFGLMASASALVIPSVFYFIGTRLWALANATGFSLRCSTSASAGTPTALVWPSSLSSSVSWAGASLCTR